MDARTAHYHEQHTVCFMLRPTVRPRTGSICKRLSYTLSSYGGTPKLFHDKTTEQSGVKFQ